MTKLHKGGEVAVPLTIKLAPTFFDEVPEDLLAGLTREEFRVKAEKICADLTATREFTNPQAIVVAMLTRLGMVKAGEKPTMTELP